MLNSIINKVWYYVTIKITEHILFFGEERIIGEKKIQKYTDIKILYFST